MTLEKNGLQRVNTTDTAEQSIDAYCRTSELLCECINTFFKYLNTNIIYVILLLFSNYNKMKM